MTLTLFVGSTGPAEATCTGPSGGVETCAGSGTQSDISYTAPGVTTLNVNTLTIDPSRISLTGSGANPAPATEVQHYTCSTGNAADCVITPEKPAQNGNPAVAESCAVASGAPAGTSCVAPPVKAAGGPSGNSGPTLVVNYNQPTANTNTPNSGAVIATGTIGVLGASNAGRQLRGIDACLRCSAP